MKWLVPVVLKLEASLRYRKTVATAMQEGGLEEGSNAVMWAPGRCVSFVGLRSSQVGFRDGRLCFLP